jgi:hypothetical protein
MPAPRVLIVMAAQWPRALLRAELIEAGYDVSGAADLHEVLAHRADDRGPGSLGLIVLDHDVLGDDRLLSQLLQGHPQVTTLVLESASRPPVPVPGAHLLRHPVSIGEIVDTIQELVPVPGRVPETDD